MMASSMQLFFIYPTILFTLFATTQCFESLSETETNKVVSVLQIIPEISCETDFYERVYWVAVMPALGVYLVAMPALLWYSLKRNAHWIFHSG